jgi:hypothetical protein
MVDIPSLERPSFFDGQRLLAGDLNATQAFHRELRWLHNRSLHNWGIAFGYAVTGKRKERTVAVQPGYALDCQGRELILTDAREIAVPPVAGGADGRPVTYYLTVSYAEDAELTPETRAGVCEASGAVRRPEQPNIRWQDPVDGYRFGLDVVLASIEVKGCQLASDASGAVRRDAVPAQQPYIAAGQTVVGQTKWRLWPNGNEPAGVATTVSTTSAGFRAAPRYQAHVVGNRVTTSGQGDGQRQVVIDGYAQVLHPTAFSFDLVVLLPRGQAITADLNPDSVVNLNLPPRLESSDPQKGGLGWHVVWMGIEG